MSIAITEILLSLIGIDDLADYSEFLFENKASISPSIVVINIALVSQLNSSTLIL